MSTDAIGSRRAEGIEIIEGPVLDDRIQDVRMEHEYAELLQAALRSQTVSRSPYFTAR